MSKTEGRIATEVEDHVAVITIDRPAKLNTLTLDMVEQLRLASAEVQQDDAVRAVVVTGAGTRAFSAGGDLTTLLPAALEARRDILNPDPTTRFFSGILKPVIAAVEGICVGGGFEMLLGTDLRVAAEDAVFGVPEGRWGLIAGSGTNVRLPKQIPWAVAMEMLLLGESIDARRAYDVGLVNRVVPKGESLTHAMDLAARVAANGPIAMATAKEIAVRSADLTAGFVLEHALNSRILSSEDASEGVRSFEEKRSARFTGR